MKQPTRQQKIDIIQEKIGRKDLSFGCKFLLETIDGCGLETKILFVKDNIGYVFGDKIGFFPLEKEFYIKEKILGHDVLLSDVLNWKDKNGGAWESIEGISYCEKIVRLWDLSKQTIQDQSDDCVDFIFNLVK